MQMSTFSFHSLYVASKHPDLPYIDLVGRYSYMRETAMMGFVNPS